MLKTFRNICDRERLNLKHLFFYTAPPYQSDDIEERMIKLKRNYDNLSKLLNYKKWHVTCNRDSIDKRNRIFWSHR